MKDRPGTQLLILRYITLILFLFTLTTICPAQLALPGFSFNKISQPDSTHYYDPVNLNLNPALPDVKAIGRGATSVSGWHGYLGMLNNPAYLSKSDFAFEMADAQVIVPETTIDAISYLGAHKEDLKNGRFLRQMEQGIYELRYYKDEERKQEAYQKIHDGSAFGDELLTNVIGTVENPTRHGFMAFPNIKFQYKNFGLSLYNVTQATFLVTSGTILNIIRDIHHADKDNLNSDLLIRTAALIYDSYVADETIDPDALPIIYSMAASSTALTFGYGKKLNDKLSVGGNLHFYRRALSVGIIESSEYNDMLNVALNGLKNPIYGINLTLGAHYKQTDKLSLGIVANNIFPSRKLETEARLNTYSSDLDYTIHGESWSDSISVDLYSQKTEIVYPVELNIPFILSTGATWTPYKSLYISAEWADMLSNDNLKYDVYYDRFRLGIEYSVLKEIISFRTGIANSYPTLGGGISIPLWHFHFDLDAAYAYTRLSDTPATFIQFKIGYRKGKNTKEKKQNNN